MVCQTRKEVQLHRLDPVSVVEWSGRGYTFKRIQGNKSFFVPVVGWMRVVSRGVKKGGPRLVKMSKYSKRWAAVKDW